MGDHQAGGPIGVKPLWLMEAVEVGACPRSSIGGVWREHLYFLFPALCPRELIGRGQGVVPRLVCMGNSLLAPNEESVWGARGLW